MARRAARRKRNSRIARKCERYGCSDTPGRDRTCDLRFRKPSLYPLSYGGGCGFPRKNKGFRFGILRKGEAANKDSPNAPQTGPPWKGMAAGRRASSARLLPFAVRLIPKSRQQSLPVGFGQSADPFQDGVQFGLRLLNADQPGDLGEWLKAWESPAYRLSARR